jgi:hypothetical protein
MVSRVCRMRKGILTLLDGLRILLLLAVGMGLSFDIKVAEFSLRVVILGVLMSQGN